MDSHRRYVSRVVSPVTFGFATNDEDANLLTSVGRPQLPPVGFLDVEKSRRDEDSYQHRLTGAPPNLPVVAAASPTYQYPTGPPPPYSHPTPAPQHHLNGLPGVHTGTQSPSESRRTNGDEKEAIRQTVRQSLPSISEALGVDNQSAYHTSLPQQAPLPTTRPAQPKIVAPSSPSPVRRSYAMEPPQLPPESHSNGQHYFSQYQHETQSEQSYPLIDTPRSAYADPRTESRPSLNVHTTQSPSMRPTPQTSHYAPPATQPSPVHQTQSSLPPTSGPSTFAYGYQPYPSRYAQPTPPSNATAGPIYQPSLTNSAPSLPSPAWKSEGPSSRYGDEERTGYGDSVKRHLELYDLEAALRDISSSSSIMTDFSRRYGDRLHQTARSGPTLSTLPGIVEVEDMMSKSRMQLDALTKIREVVVAQQVAYDQQAAEQRQQQKSFAEPSLPTVNSEGEDSKAGFAGSDTKKRRGRAAPPGRCHSCNRAETPEWRRGPDGARTLCNACGLHYAKLTRKQNNANKNAAVGSSNLRPKESMP